MNSSPQPTHNGASAPSFPSERLPSPESLTKLPRSFYIRGSVTVARELLGKFLLRRLDGRLMGGRIVEVEAYRGTLDPASHAYRGRTARNEVMFREGGYLYVYFTYGMHFCCNVVTGRAGRGEAVLIRAVEPLWGIQAMALRRTLPASRPTLLCSGPGRTCQALAIGRPENGADLCGDTIWIASPPASTSGVRVSRTSRIGIRHGREHQWRFFVTGSPYCSPGRPS